MIITINKKYKNLSIGIYNLKAQIVNLRLSPSVTRHLKLRRLIFREGVFVSSATNVTISWWHRSPEESSRVRPGKVHRNISMFPDDRKDLHMFPVVHRNSSKIVAAIDFLEDSIFQDFILKIFFAFVDVKLWLSCLLIRVFLRLVFLQQAQYWFK